MSRLRYCLLMTAFLLTMLTVLAVGCSDDDNPSASTTVKYAWAPLGSGLNGGVESIVVYQDKLIAIGEFTAAGGTGASHVAAWDGSVWSSLGTGINGSFSLALGVDDNKLYAGGDFTTAGGISAAGVACWNGTTWSPLGDGVSGSLIAGFPTMVGAFVVYDDKLIVGGNFKVAGGVGANGVQAVPSQAAMRLALVPPAVVKSPPA